MVSLGLWVEIKPGVNIFCRSRGAGGEGGLLAKRFIKTVVVNMTRKRRDMTCVGRGKKGERRCL